MRRSSFKPRTDAPTFGLHWLLVLAVLASGLTGFRIASDDARSIAGTAGRRVLGILPEGAVIEWHVWSGWLVTFIAVCYGIYLWRSRLSRRVKLDRTSLRALLRAPGSGRPASGNAFWFAVNRVVFLIAFVLVGLMAVTGWMLYSGVRLGVSTYAVQTVHGLAAWSFLGYTVVHVAVVLKVGMLMKMLRPPRLGYGTAVLSGAGVAVVVIGGAYLTDRSVHPVLAINEVENGPVLRGDGGDPAWIDADSVSVLTVRGANLPDGESRVHVRAVHDGQRVYFRFRWEDPQRSQKHLPLLKTEEGWTVLQSGYETNDENEYYEDKFAVILATEPRIASGTVHLGQDVIPGPHRANPRGLHFTRDGSIVDLWHWKSVRTGGMTPSFADDNYIGPPMLSEAPDERYTGGYTQDPPGSPHPYELNFTKVDPTQALDETRVRPNWLPRDPEVVLSRMGEIDLDPTAGDVGQWFMRADEVVPYEASLDDFPVGTVLPGVVIHGPLEGDRADLRAEAEWSDGYWTLEVTRQLDTGSPYDIPLVPGEDVFMWVAVFNHTQTRHSQHLHPVRLVLQ